MADQDVPARSGSRSAAAADEGSIGDLVATVKEYAKQETLGPLRGAGRWLGFGIAGALLLGIGSALLLLGLLRLLEHEFAPTFRGRWMSLLPYLITVVASVVVIGLAISRISKSSLNRPDR